MRVESPNDRQEMPEECDVCQSPVKLKRYSHYGPGHQVDWLCKYCAISTNTEERANMAAMLNLLERALKDDNGKTISDESS